jgi:hypothetical protein
VERSVFKGLENLSSVLTQIGGWRGDRRRRLFEDDEGAYLPVHPTIEISDLYDSAVLEHLRMGEKLARVQVRICADVVLLE